MTLLHTIYLVAIAAEAASGALMGMRRRMDLFGLCVIGTVTALGGGTVRDIILGHYPLGWVAHPEYLAFTAGAALVSASRRAACTACTRPSSGSTPSAWSPLASSAATSRQRPAHISSSSS